MNQSNFNPKEYETLNNVRKKIIKDFKKKRIFEKSKVLDIGCGTGLFSYEIARAFKDSFVYGIDIVKNYVFYANKNNKHSNARFETISYNDINSKYDVITLFLGLTELLKYENLNTILKRLEHILTDEGYIIICDEFSDDYSLEKDLLGIELMQTIGYKYLTKNDFQKAITKSKYELIETKLYCCKTQTTNFNGTKVKIFYENKLNEFDNTKKIESDDIWKKYKSRVIKINGIRTNNFIRTYLLKKKNEKIDHILTIKKENPLLVYDCKKLQENIDYYSDLTKEFSLEYLFPVKAFPHEKILQIFANNNFGFDVSNKNELKLVDTFKKAYIMFSDPTLILHNLNGIRINMHNKYIKSHFGNIYDNNYIYKIIHIHVSESKTTFVLNEMISRIKKINFEKVEILNLGGGYEELSYQEFRIFISTIKKIIPISVKLILEPGSMWFKNCGYLITRVMKINKLRNINYVYLNSSRELHLKWSIPKILKIYSKSNISNNYNNYVFCGASCYEKDIFLTYKSKIELMENDIIIFNEVESYSYSWNSTFNGIEKAEVYFYE